MRQFDQLYQQILSEKFSDFHPTKGKLVTLPNSKIENDDDFKNELYSLIDLTYLSIGGHLNIKGPDDIPGDNDGWSAVDVSGDGEPDVVFANKTKGKYTKNTLTATDGTDEAKKKMLEIRVKTLKERGQISEVSDALAHILITRYNVPFINDETTVRSILKKDDIAWIGENPNGKYPGYDGWYTRKIGGKLKLKILVGTEA